MRAVRFGSLLVLLLAVAALGSNPTPQLEVSTDSGDVRGFIQDDIARAFLGIPFADPPQRFGIAQPVTPWSGVLNATSFPLPCLQSSSLGVEDCLYLNVFTPKIVKNNAKLPVMVWIHGGRYWTGQSDQYAGQWLAGNGDLIVVTIQYRLNSLGFFATPELAAAGSTNVGFQDQILAIEWVRDNIENFGGDPDQITLFGESAGGNAAMLHTMVHKYTNPSCYLEYAQNVILQSVWQWVMPTLAQQMAASVKFAASKGCNQANSADMLACMRALPASSVVATSGPVNYFQPSVDGIFLTDQPYNLIKRGEYNTDVNVIIGFNEDEGHFMALTRSGWKTPASTVTYSDYYRAVRNNSLVYWLTDDQTNEVFSWYADNTAQVGYWYGISDILGHFYVQCGSQLAIRYFAKHGPTFAYIWNYTSPNYPDQFLEAAHGNEIPYIFNSTVYTAYPFATKDYLLTSRMLASWARIADKNKPKTSEWPKWKKNRPVAFLWEQNDENPDPPTRTVPFFKSNLCSNWEPIFSSNSLVQP